MKIFVTLPSFSLHGGIRIILEWANRLVNSGHTVFLRVLKRRDTRCDWFALDRKVNVVFNDDFLARCDLLLITSPHAVHYLNVQIPDRKLIFLQMMEHLFHPNNPSWQTMCSVLYRASYSLISISLWNWQSLLEDFQRTNPVHYIGNGINFADFPIIPKLSTLNSQLSTILVEGWDTKNPTKDPDRIGPRVAARLKKDGHRIIVYTARAPLEYVSVPDRIYIRPDLKTLNQLYSEATILLKASRYDARALAPLEAMTKGTPTARAIIKGDDDLTHDHNCLRCDYEENALYLTASRLIEDKDLRNRLSAACLQHVQESASWANWWPKIEQLLCQ